MQLHFVYHTRVFFIYITQGRIDKRIYLEKEELEKIPPNSNTRL